MRLQFVRGVEVEFADREVAIGQVEGLAERGTRFPLVIFGPEGCGKTAWLKQTAEILRGAGYRVLYVNPNEELFEGAVRYTEDLAGLVEEVFRELVQYLGVARAITHLALAVADRALRKFARPRLAILIDDVFQAMGLDRAASYVKSALNLIEYPPSPYESMVIIIATSEGVSRRKIGRHRWAELRPMWNMSREGLRALYDALPGGKPDFDRVWRWTGGNPWLLARLYEAGWDVDIIIREVVEVKEITPSFVVRWRSYLERAVEDPEQLWSPDVPGKLVKELVERNLVAYNLYDRDQRLWVDQPPPEDDPELGIGKHVAWQTPMYRDAVRRALEEVGAA